MELKEYRVVSVKRGIGPIAKRKSRHGAGSEYALNVVLVLDDGQELETVDAHTRLRDAKAEEASLPHVSRNNHTVKLNDKGEIVMQGHRYATMALLGALGAAKLNAEDIRAEREALNLDANGNDIAL